MREACSLVSQAASLHQGVQQQAVGSTSGTARRTPRSSGQSGQSGQAAVSTSLGSGTSHWIETYRRRGKVCFKDLNGEEIQTELKEWTEHTVDEMPCYYWQSAASQPSFAGGWFKNPVGRKL
jgi:hypothetical protein